MRDYPYILAAFFEEYGEGYEFERWPRHITVLPWFKADKDALAGIKRLAEEHLPVGVELGGTAMFGTRGDVLVRIVESEPLRALHRALLSERGGLLGLSNSRHAGEDYRPHVTLQGQNDPMPGPRQIEAISLIRKIEPGKTKRVVENYRK